MDWFLVAWLAFAAFVCVGAFFSLRRQNIALTRQREAMELQVNAVATQEELLATLRRLVDLTEEANRQRGERLNPQKDGLEPRGSSRASNPIG